MFFFFTFTNKEIYLSFPIKNYVKFYNSAIFFQTINTILMIYFSLQNLVFFSIYILNFPIILFCSFHFTSFYFFFCNNFFPFNELIIGFIDFFRFTRIKLNFLWFGFFCTFFTATVLGHLHSALNLPFS